MLDKRKKIIPIVFFELYLSFTVLLFAFGPWDWEIDNSFILYGYLIGSQLFLFWGYLSGLRYVSKPKIIEPPIKLIKISIALNLLISIPLIYIRSGGNFSFIIQGFLDPGYVYNVSREAVLPYNITEYINIVISPITWSLVPWVIFYWRDLSGRLKFFSIFAIFWGTIIPYIASGTNKGLFDIFLVIICLRLFIYLAKNKLTSNTLNKKAALSFLAITAFFILLINYFSTNIEQRVGAEDFISQIAVNMRADNASVKSEFIQSNLPDGIKNSIIALSNYISQGYYGLSLALKEDFVPTFGIGNSRFLSWLIGDLLLGMDVKKKTYPNRVSEKSFWDVDIVWSSIYPWLASDFSFLGSYIIIFIIGRLLAMSWLSIFINRDAWAVIVYSLLCIMIFYFSANNQVFQTGTTTTAFFVSLILWLNRIKKIST